MMHIGYAKYMMLGVLVTCVWYTSMFVTLTVWYMSLTLHVTVVN